MRRQGRQHGMVRTYPIMAQEQRTSNELSSVPTAGLFTRTSSKPTNHSKFTGRRGRCKCYTCHSHPVSKSKDKVKGAQKIRSFSDIVSNHRLITWRVVDTAPSFKVSGFSASGVLNYLDSVDDNDHDHDHGYEGLDHNYGFDGSYDDHEIEEDVDVGDVVEDDNDDGMSFCEVGFVWEAVDGERDESWCLVEEI